MSAPDRITVTDEMQEAFALWFRQNYPGPDTIIHKPDWRAPRIFRAALGVIPKTAATSEADALREENAILRTEKHADSEAIGALREALECIASDNPCTCRKEYSGRGMVDPECLAYWVGDDARIALGRSPACRQALKGDA